MQEESMQASYSIQEDLSQEPNQEPARYNAIKLNKYILAYIL